VKLLIAIGISLFLQSQPPSDRRAQVQKPEANNIDSKTTPSATGVTVVNNQQSNPQIADKATTEPQQKPEIPPPWDVAWSTWGLVFVGLTASGVAYFTLKDIKKQTQNTEESVRALVAAERSLVMVEMRDIPGITMVAIGEHLGAPNTGGQNPSYLFERRKGHCVG
jgi:hypothetical protein